MEERKKTYNLQIELKALLATGQKVIELSGKERSVKGANPFFNYLKKYQQCFSKTEPDEHKPFIEKMFQRHRDKFLRWNSATDGWVRDSNIAIIYGDGVEGTSGTARIPVSYLYRLAADLKIDTEAKLISSNAPDHQWEGAKELIYPDIILLHLFRSVYLSISDEADKDALSKHIFQVEDILSPPTTPPPLASPQGTQDMGELANVASSVASQVVGGIASSFQPPGSKQPLPSPQDIGKIVNGIFNSPGIKGMISSFSTMGNKGGPPPDLGAVFGVVAQSLQDPSFKKTMEETAANTIASHSAAKQEAQVTELPPDEGKKEETTP